MTKLTWLGVGICLAIAWVVPAPAHAEITVTICGPGCICIDWDRGFGSYVEVRCTSGGGGWTTTPPGPGDPPPAGPGSFGGGPDPQSPQSPAPCNPLTAPQQQRLNFAKSYARTKLSRVRVNSPEPATLPTTCTELFKHSPLGRSGLNLLDDYVVFRNGQNCSAPDGANPCAEGKAAWTTCCGHRPEVFLCNSFANLSNSDAGLRLIHELLHVAGQIEDGSSTSGPGDPPTSGQINDIVRDACRDPQVVQPGE